MEIVLVGLVIRGGVEPIIQEVHFPFLVLYMEALVAVVLGTLRGVLQQHRVLESPTLVAVVVAALRAQITPLI